MPCIVIEITIKPNFLGPQQLCTMKMVGFSACGAVHRCRFSMLALAGLMWRAGSDRQKDESDKAH